MKNRKLWKPQIAGLLALALVLGLLGGIKPARVSAESSSEIQNQIDALENEKADLEAQKDALDSQMLDNVTEMKDAVEQKQRIDQQVANLYAQIVNINKQISAYSVLIADKQDELNEAQKRFDALNEKNIERIRAMEEDGALSYWSVLFKATSFADLLDRMNMIEEIAAADRRRLDELNAAAQDVQNAKDTLTEEKSALDDTKASLDAINAELEEKRQEADELLAELVARGEEYEQELIKVEEAKAAVLLNIAEREAARAEAAYQEWLATYVPPTTEPSSPSEGGDSEGGSSEGEADPPRPPVAESDWLTPLDNYWITSPFGERVHPITGEVRVHYGVDMAWDEGTPIYASRSGLVTTAGWDDACGNHVVLAHGDGYSSIYMHMSGFAVSEGDYVNQGQVIGYIGSTGWSTGPHLHFGIMTGGSYVNPGNYIYLDPSRYLDDD